MAMDRSIASIGFQGQLVRNNSVTDLLQKGPEAPAHPEAVSPAIRRAGPRWCGQGAYSPDNARLLDFKERPILGRIERDYVVESAVKG